MAVGRSFDMAHVCFESRGKFYLCGEHLANYYAAVVARKACSST